MSPNFVAPPLPLQDRLDPIDWATYEPYLWVNEARYYQRGAVLLGALVQLNRVHSGAPGRMAANAETNTLNTAPPVPRFPYLPISAPTASNGDMPATPSTADAKAQAVMASQVSTRHAHAVEFGPFCCQPEGDGQHHSMRQRRANRPAC